MRRVAFTVDVEQDAPPYFATWRGMEDGLPRLCELLERYAIHATFFVTGVAALRYPLLVQSAAASHEIGCHGFNHERYDRLPADEQNTLIRKATQSLRQVTSRSLNGFRAPNFRYDDHTMRAVREAGYTYDASRASYHRAPRGNPGGLPQVSNTFPSSVLRLPLTMSTLLLDAAFAATRTVVLDFHPWELVPMSGVRADIRFATGRTALQRLDALFSTLQNDGVAFVTMSEVAATSHTA